MEEAVLLASSQALKLQLKDSFKLFDKDLGTNSKPNLTLQLRFYNNDRKNEALTDDFIIDNHKSIRYKQQCNGFEMPIENSINNILAHEASRCANNFGLWICQYDKQTRMTVGEGKLFSCHVDGELSILPETSANTSSINSVNDANFANENESANSQTDASFDNTSAQNQTNSTTKTAQKSSNFVPTLIKILVGLLVLIALIVGAWYLFRLLSKTPSNASSTNSTQVEQSVEKTKDEIVDTAATDAIDNSADTKVQTDAQAQVTPVDKCDLSNLDKDILNNCVTTQSNYDEVATLITKALEQERCDLVKRIIYSNGRQDPKYALLYANFANPNDAKTTKCIKKDAKSAKYWYQKAIDLGDDSAKEALSKLQ